MCNDCFGFLPQQKCPEGASVRQSQQQHLVQGQGPGAPLGCFPGCVLTYSLWALALPLG